MLQLNESIFQEAVNTGKPMVIMVSASWCQPCRRLKPLFTKLHEEMSSKLGFFTIDSDSSPELCAVLKVSAIPTLIFIVGSQIRATVPGVVSEKRVREEIASLLES